MADTFSSNARVEVNEIVLDPRPNIPLAEPLDSHRVKRYLLRQQTCG